MAARHTMTLVDASNENTNFGLPGVDLTAGNYAAQAGLWDALVTAVAAIIIGNVGFKKLQAYVTAVNNVVPSNNFAQREEKWLVTWTDDVLGTKHTTEIGTPDLDLLVSGSDLMNIETGAGADFVTAFEAVVRGGPTGANAVSVISIRNVGRNL